MNSEGSSPKEEEKIIFLIGAGASIDCGIPGAKEMLTGFGKTLGEEKKNIFSTLVEKENPDLEQFIKELHALADLGENVRQDVLKTLLNNFEEISKVSRLARELENDILDYIYEKCYSFNHDKVISVYGNLLSLINHLSLEKMHLFSLNYDVCVEYACNEKGIGCDSGSTNDRFGELVMKFEEEVCLYKLHGSVSWHEDESEGIIREHINYEESNRMWRSKARMIFPAIGRSYLYQYPFLELLSIFKGRLRNSDLLVSIGCSFGDEHIRNLIERSAQENKNLILIVIAPDGEELVSKTFSNLNIKVVGINGKMSSVKEIICDKMPDRIKPFYSIVEAEKSSDIKVKGQKYSKAIKMFLKCKDYFNTEKYCTEYIRICEKTVDSELLGDTYFDLGEVYFYKNFLSKARNSYFLSLKYYRRMSEGEMRPQIWDRMGKMYRKLGKSLEAYKSYEKAFLYYDKQETEEEANKYKEIMSSMGQSIEKNKQRREKLSQIQFKFGKGYFIETDTPGECAQIFTRFARKKMKEVWITIDSPDNLKDMYGLNETEFLQLYGEEEGRMSVQSLMKIMDTLEEKSIVLLDCLVDIYKGSRDINSFLQFISYLLDEVRNLDLILIVPSKRENFTEKEFAILQEEFEIVLLE